MRAVKVKAIRRAMRRELEAPQTYRVVFHSEVFENMKNQICVKYKAQYVLQGGKRLVKVGKAIYRMSGILPRRNSGKPS